MSDTKQETVADIVSWLRTPQGGENGYITAWKVEISDRIEAAWKREEATWKGLVDVAKELAVHERKEADRRVEEVAKRERELSKTAENDNSGNANVSNDNICNAAAMREALINAKEVLIKCLDGDNCPTEDDIRDEIGKIEAALAVPPRNCDRFKTRDDAAREYLHLAANANLPDKEAMDIADWLLATAEAKGETDGK